MQELDNPGAPADAREAELQQDLQLSALVKDGAILVLWDPPSCRCPLQPSALRVCARAASEALAADLSHSLRHYQAWSSGRLRRTAARQAALHAKLDEAEAKAKEASLHVAK